MPIAVIKGALEAQLKTDRDAETELPQAAISSVVSGVQC
jgi:hypothetical protein